MSLQINFALNSILMQVPNVLESHQESIQIDGFRQMFLALKDIATRLNIKAIFLAVNGSTYSESELIININSIATDIWAMIDQARRVLMFGEQVQLKVADQRYLYILNQVKKVRDSFNHLEDRLPRYFYKNGQSILGDISWYYRPTLGGKDSYFYIRTSSTIHPTDVSPPIAVTVGQSKYKHRVGIYNLTLHYVKQDKKEGPYSIAVINLEEVCMVVNLAIVTLETFFEEKLALHDFANRKSVPLLLHFSEA